MAINSLFAQFDFFSPTTKLGGYGELHYNSIKPENGKSSATLDFHRFVLFYSHSWTEKWSLKAEVELEHNFVKNGQGELELEQAYVNYHHSEAFGFQAGVILSSVGLINETHEPPTFLGTERPDYHKLIIPTTWFGNGVALYGLVSGFDYKFTVMEGLNANKFNEKSAIRDSRYKGYRSDADNLLYTGRIDYIGLPGLRLGGSFTYNNAGGDSLNNAINIFELHARYRANNIYADAEFGNISYNKGNLQTSQGYYVNFGYALSALFGIETKIIPFIQYNDLNTASSTKTGGDEEKRYHIKQIMVGLSILPIDEVVFKIDYSQDKIELNNKKTNYLNIGVGYMF